MSTPTWRKSTHSDASGNSCVEAARLPGAVGLKDGQNPEAGHLTVSAAAFGGLLTRIRSGELDL
ncbi:DUF397 domain-containing protein [Actinomadura sp. HBU206391]|uniref:DUF397 domain-containing protein n=1 Tax=Actinomadura sp. HBU206391 TaxID=2731692 RepID=UPI00164F3212|nr:DUF397 domain-containing protein [Actinomadura sp. HBU206391]MBC6458390.1 DUF397 domain-containing protein [Actinomadura sp. HBU206391]